MSPPTEIQEPHAFLEEETREELLPRCMSDLIQKFAAELSASFARRFVLAFLVGQGRQCLRAFLRQTNLAGKFRDRLAESGH